MNTRIATSIIALAVLSLGAGLAPVQAAQTEKPARAEARTDVEHSTRASQVRGRQGPPVKNGAVPSAPPPARGDRGRDGRGHDDRHDRDDRRQDRPRPAYQPTWRDGRDSHHRYDDSRHRHEHARYDDRRPGSDHHYPVRRYDYPPRGYVAPVLPRNVVVVRHHHHKYWYGGGVWYRPYGTRYVVVAPPVGVFVSVLPSFYSTRWFGGVPYYYANDVHYVWREVQRAYQVVAPPWVP